MKLLQYPPKRFDVIIFISDVGILKINPIAHFLGQVVPNIGVLHHLSAAGSIVIVNTYCFANIIFFQRIRANAFYDHTNAKARVNGLLTEIKNRSTGGEVYFDTKIWNAFPLSFGLRFSHLLDTDLINPLVRNRWEIIVPIGFIPD